MAPRDGLQNEKTQISTADKIKLVDSLSDCGFKKIEVTSFVSPKWVPQLADASDVMAGIRRDEGVVYGVLTPNMRGFEGAVAAKASEVAIFAAASEGFSQKNINCSIAESIERFAPIMVAAKAAGLPVRGYVSCVTDCPYDGRIEPSEVARITEHLLAAGCFEVSLGDTIGAGTPETIDAMLAACLEVADPLQLAGHYHDTGGRAVENIEVSLARGLRTFDAAAGGLGGCPYAPGAKGNVDTVLVNQRLKELGFHTGLDAEKLSKAASFAVQLRGVSA
eukprot:snap_masked-scaffold1_size3401120-processed-gene-5.13 protein:Tk04862 transcript:snap_masked-scaffold1_size3401120-processed-gene-5.13-mRNA-1 annotation:"isopropylmalate homocitrate citramalate synthase"